MDRELWAIIGVAVGALAIIVAVGLWLSSASCSAKFEGSQLQHRWSLMGGCRVNTPEQGWITAENYRVI